MGKRKQFTNEKIPKKNDSKQYNLNNKKPKKLIII